MKADKAGTPAEKARWKINYLSPEEADNAGKPSGARCLNCTNRSQIRCGMELDILYCLLSPINLFPCVDVSGWCQNFAETDCLPAHPRWWRIPTTAVPFIHGSGDGEVIFDYR
ncbi:MAG: hypothetical protein WC340_10305 [Kiritimatiellia bacterium]